MTRYFYTDPLAAAWMAKHFGMRFLSSPNAYYTDVEMPTSIISYENKGYVHPENFHLLQPQVDDVCLVREEEEEPDIYTRLYDLDLIARGIHQVLRIIQRNHLPFHWPEVEHG